MINNSMLVIEKFKDGIYYDAQLDTILEPRLLERTSFVTTIQR